MQQLNLPPAQLRTRSTENRIQVFDEVRKKYVVLTPEEWVRQHFIHYLVKHLNYSPGLVAVEIPVNVNGLSQRADIVLYNKKGKPVVIVECKAPDVPVTRRVFNQAARYNTQLKVDYLIVTNGLQHYCARLLDEQGNYELQNAIPTAGDVY